MGMQGIVVLLCRCGTQIPIPVVGSSDDGVHGGHADRVILLRVGVATTMPNHTTQHWIAGGEAKTDIRGLITTEQ